MPTSHHQYSTRTRHNVEIRPSQRRRQSPVPLTSPTLKTAPVATDTASHAIPFPPHHIVLHPDDANSRVFLAIGRSFLSVDNRAMTIKDLAEMTVKFGLVCQNVSAASQAITTYIRSHMQRCEMQQDTPLLLKHSLSGTSLDDDLLPALYSHSGGAHCTSNPENRVTNFRRGTIVWYLSRATGAPCPFARAGIRLCDYAESRRLEQKKVARIMAGGEEQSCGQKRKRLLRGRLSQTDDDSDSSDEDVQRPPKVKLTFRLKPLNQPSSQPRHVVDVSHISDSDDSMSTSSSSDDEREEENKIQDEEPWSLPPYPRRSISIPSYTPCLATFSSYPFYSDAPSSSSVNQYYRSPSVPYSIGSPPPDSEDEDDFSVAMTRPRTFLADELQTASGADWDSDGDGETIWESPGPRSPSAPAPLVPPDASDLNVTIKQELHDVQGMLDAWDDYDSSIASEVKPLPISPASTDPIKLESSLWDWDNRCNEWLSPLLDDFFTASSPSAPVRTIKEEDMEFDCLLALSPSYSALSEGSPTLVNEDGNQIKVEKVAIENSFALPVAPSPSQLPSLPLRLELPTYPFSFPDVTQSPTLTTLASLIQSMSMGSPTAVSPAALQINSPSAGSSSGLPIEIPSADPVVVYTCHPCTPTVSATQVEGISVYQMTLGSSRLLRRIDTDFVNLSPIATYADMPIPNSPTAVVVSKGSIATAGTWVPLSAAQTFVQSCLAQRSSPSKLSPSQQYTMQALLDIFLSDVLFERFPTALQDFHRSSTARRLLNQFGPHFQSTINLTVPGQQELGPPQFSSQPACAYQGLSLPPSLSWVPAGHPRKSDAESPSDHETPLSPREQEIFHALCANPEWERDSLSTAASTKDTCVETASPSRDLGHLVSATLTVPSGNTVPPETHKAEEGSVHSHELKTPPVDVPQPKSVSKRASTSNDRPLRRSKRVADALATKTQTRSSRRRGSTKSLA